MQQFIRDFSVFSVHQETEFHVFNDMRNKGRILNLDLWSLSSTSLSKEGNQRYGYDWPQWKYATGLPLFICVHAPVLSTWLFLVSLSFYHSDSYCGHLPLQWPTLSGHLFTDLTAPNLTSALHCENLFQLVPFCITLCGCTFRPQVNKNLYWNAPKLLDFQFWNVRLWCKILQLNTTAIRMV